MDYARLRDDLKRYFGTMVDNGFPMSAMELCDVEICGEERLTEIAKQIGFNLSDYKVSAYPKD